jgi:hypothetical protein
MSKVATEIAALSAAKGPTAPYSAVLDASTGESLVIPGGHMLLVADFQRQGSDLVLIGPDGEVVFIRGYFAQEHPPVLLTEGGAQVTPELASSLAGPAAPGQYAQAGPGGQAEPIGSVEVSDGDVFITRTNGTRVRGEKGVEVYQGDVVETGDGGSLGVVLADDTTFSLGEDGRLVLDELVYDPGTQTGTSAISVVQGVFTFVSGQIAKTGPDAMTVTTPVASIGIRGTTVAGRAAAEGETNTITLLADDTGRVGEISISNAGGVQVLSVANQTTQVTSFFSSPAAPVVLAAAQVEQLFGSALQARPPQPTRQDNDEEAAADQQDAEGESDAAEGEGEGEATEGEGEGEGEAAAEGEAGPGDEQLAFGPDGPGPEGGPDGPGPDGEVLTPEEQAAKTALEAAIAGGASAEEAFAAAAEAATQEALAQGADPAEVEAAKSAVEAAFQQALASGADPEAAMTAAMASVGAPGEFGAPGNLGGTGEFGGQGDFGAQGDFGDTGDFGGTDDFGFGGSGDFGFGGPDHFGGPGDFGFGGSGFDNLGFDDPFGFEDPFSFDGEFGIDFGFEPPPGTPEEFSFIDDPDDPTSDEPPTIVFDDDKPGTSGNDILVGGAGNTNFFFHYDANSTPVGGNVGGTDTVTGQLSFQNQIAFDNLDDVKIKFSMGGSDDAGTIAVWADFDGSNASSETSANSTVAFTGVTQYLFSDVNVAAFQGGYTDQSEVDPSAQTDPIDDSGDVIVMPSLDASDVGYVYAGTSGADTFTLSNTTDGVIVFGKGGADTFNIQVASDALLIGGITATDNVDGNADGIPDTGINTFSYATLFSGTTGIVATLEGEGVPGPGGDAFVKENVGSPTLFNVLWDVGAFTGSAGDDLINVNGGGYSAINGAAGDDVVVLGGSANVGSIDGGTHSSGDVFRAIYNNTATVTGTVTNFEIVQLGGSATADAINFATHTTSGQVFGVTVNSVDAGAGVDSVALLTNTATTMSIANAETITATGTGNDTVNLTSSLLSGSSIDLDGNTDVVNLLGGTNTASISNVETINGTSGVDTLTLENTQSSGTTVNLLGDGDVLNLAAGTNILNILNVEAVNGTTSADILTVQNVLAANQVLDGGGDTDTLNLGSTSNNTVTVANFETVNGNAGIDTISAQGSTVATTISGGGGNDILTGSTAGDTLLGGADSDTLTGGQGNDTLTGGAAADLFAFQGGTGAPGSFALAQSLGTDIITDFFAGTDLFGLSNADFSFGGSGTLSATASSLTYVETATAITGTGFDTDGGDSSTGAAVVIVGAATGTAGVEVWYTTAQENADTSNSYQIASVNGINTSNVSNTDFTLIA